MLLLIASPPPPTPRSIFVNFPEPAQQNNSEKGGGLFESQAKHVLSAEFFASAERALCEQGVLTIVTDNLWFIYISYSNLPTS